MIKKLKIIIIIIKLKLIIIKLTDKYKNNKFKIRNKF